MGIRFSIHGDRVLVDFWGPHFLDYKIIMNSLGFPRFDWDQKSWTFPISLFKRISPIIATLPETAELSRELYDRLLADKVTHQKVMKIREAVEYDFIPEGFKGTLLTFQKIGTAFLVEGKKVVLGDDVGLGKTVQTLAALTHLIDTGKVTSALIVAPGHLKRQWEKEIEKFTYCESVLVEGPRKKRAYLLQHDAQIFITNYELLTRDPEYLAREWGVIIFDEAQEIKNWKTNAAKLSRKMIADYKWALTATPLENSLPELHSIVEFVAPSVLGQWDEFERMYVVRNIYGQIEGSSNLEHLKEKLKPYLIRRRTIDCLTDFPVKESKIVELAFSPEERALYKDVETRVLEGLDEDRARQVNQSPAMVQVGYLRQACNHCKLIDAELDIPSTKINWVKQMVAMLRERGEKCVIFTEWKRMAVILRKELNDCPTLYGGMTFGRRHSILEAWKQNDEPLVTTDCSNVGLNLQQANWLINYEMHWNPAVMKQRAGRVWRLTQERKVHVRAPMIYNSVEESVFKALAGKTNLFKDVIDGIASEARKVSRHDREPIR